MTTSKGIGSTLGGARRAHAVVFRRSRFNAAGFVSLFIIAIAVLVAVFADLLTPYSPLKPSLAEVLMPPSWLQGGSWAHPLGTDAVGRDILARMIFGARMSLIVAATAIGLGAIVGAFVGITAGYVGGKVGAVLMRLTDATLSLDVIITALILAATLGAMFTNVLICVSMVLWARWARVIRAEVLSLKERDFVALARVAGCSRLHIMWHHLLPNVFNTLMVLATLQVGWVIVVEAALSFLGAGIPPPTPSWGNMVADGREFLVTGWWISLFPGLAIMLIVLAFNLCGDWLRDTVDPTLRQV